MDQMMRLCIYSLVSLLLFSLSTGGANPLSSCSIERGSTLKIFHISSPCSPLKPSSSIAWDEDVIRRQDVDNARVQVLASLAATKPGVPIASGRVLMEYPSYIVMAQVGTPAQFLYMSMDISSNVGWLPCEGCAWCPSSVFNTSDSTTFERLRCSVPQCAQVPQATCSPTDKCFFSSSYAGSILSADLSVDTLTLGPYPVPKYVFGCLLKVTGVAVPPQGLLGLGRGPLSLFSQTQNLYKSTFSYCLPSMNSFNFTGSLRLGPVGQPKHIKTTGLLTNPRRPSLYYVELVGIKIGRKVLAVPPTAARFDPNTGGGTILDTGTVYTQLVPELYTALRDEFRLKVSRDINATSLGGFDTCYKMPIVPPSITFLFSGLKMTLQPENFLIHSSFGGTTCLAMSAAKPNNAVLNVIGSMMQQNRRVLIDVPNSRVGMSHEKCS